jgi:hypothetical protein
MLTRRDKILHEMKFVQKFPEEGQDVKK